jgi:hypothetical protein
MRTAGVTPKATLRPRGISRGNNQKALLALPVEFYASESLEEALAASRRLPVHSIATASFAYYCYYCYYY